MIIRCKPCWFVFTINTKFVKTIKGDNNMKKSVYPFSLPPLSYEKNAFEPYISAQTVEYHYEKHFAAYVNKLNTALAKYPEYHKRTLYELVKHSYVLPYELQIAVNKNGGGVYNHSLYFDSITDKKTSISQNLIMQAEYTFGSTDNMLKEFKTKAIDIFGSGYCAICCDSRLKLCIMTTPNQSTVLPLNLYPLVVCDMWEHSYYLDYKNEKSRYVDTFINFIDWEEANKRYEAAKKDCGLL